MDSNLNKLISVGATIITPTQRLSRHIRYQYATEQIAQGNVEPTLQDVMKELRELKAQITANNEHSTVSKTS